MALIPREIVEAVRDRTDLVALIGRHVRLEKRGKDWTGLCPFHKEKSASFHVIPSKQFYYCYGCQASGDCFGFLTKFENLTFYEAVKQLAEAAGIRIEEAALSPAMAAQITATQRRLRVLDAAAQHFQSLLWVGQEGADARAYLRSRELPDDVAQAFGLGLSPAGFHALSDMLTRKGVDPEDVIAAGLAKRSDTGGTYDLFRNRLMIPITDARGRTVAFGGRLLTGEGPKYINSPETALYHKGSVLYGWAAAQKQMRTSRRVILVEGYFDVIAMHRAGISEAVATCGTALTEDHVKMIRTMVPAVYLLTDTDRAGEIAAEKALPLLREAGLQTFRPTLVDAKDPDEALQKHGAEALQAALSSAETLLSAVARRKLREYGFNAGGKLRALDEMLELLPDVADVEVQELASTLGMTVTEVNKRRNAQPRSAKASPSDGEGQPTPPPRLVLSRPNMHLLWLALHRRDEVADLLDAVVPSDLDTCIRPIVARLLSGEPALRLLDEALPDDLRDLLARGLARTELYAPSEARQALAENAMVLAFERLDAAMSELKDRKPSTQEAAADPERLRAWLGKAAAINQRKKDATAAMQRKDWAAALDVLRRAG